MHAIFYGHLSTLSIASKVLFKISVHTHFGGIVSYRYCKLHICIKGDNRMRLNNVYVNGNPYSVLYVHMHSEEKQIFVPPYICLATGGGL